MDWNLIRLFVEIVEAGSMSEVARRRGITRSSVSQRLSLLEHETEIGRTLFEHGRQIAYQFEAARQDVQSLGTTLRGFVRVSVPPGIGHSHIQPALIAFAGQHPELSLNVTFNNRVIDLIAADVDIALCVTPRPPDDVVARELYDIGWQLYCTPGYLEQFGPLETPEDLQRAAFLTTFWSRRVDLSLVRGDEAISVALTPRLVSESVAFLRDCMLQNLGVAQLSHYILRDLLAEGRVVRVLPGFRLKAYDSKIFILTMPNRFHTPAMNAVIEVLRLAVTDAIGTDTPG
jgi:DNA-binding transcriptional LysR family regulator